MAILPIVKYGDPVLRNPTAPVTDLGPDLQTLIEDMTETMYHAPGVGLAANQVGVGLRLMIIDLSVGRRDGELHVCINPEIVERDGENTEEEGCLSLPDFSEVVTRPSRAVLRYLDREGVERQMEGRDLMARAMCHEVDHLEGTLYIDYLRGLRKEKILRRVKKLAKSGDW